MADALLIFGFLLVIVAGAVILWHGLDVHLVKALRNADLAEEREARAEEDAAWSSRQEAYAAAMSITLRRAALTSPADVAAALESRERVVA